MSKEVTVILLGFAVAVLPYLGLPGSWRTALLVLGGLAVATLGFFLRREVLARGTTHTQDFFVDNRPREAQPTSNETQTNRPRVG